MRCSKCDFENPVSHRFCGECGNSLTLKCPSCNFENLPSSKFCGECGKPLSQEQAKQSHKNEAISDAERRHLTVMFCDLVDSTKLSRMMDPEELRHLNLAYQETCTTIINKFGGFVARYMGDGVLAYFGYPVAHEDDTQRSVLASLELIDAISKLAAEIQLNAVSELHVRIGIATGTVIVGDLIGEGASQEAAVVGETPNLAARLQALSAPDTVHVADETRKLCSNQFIFKDLGMQHIRGYEREQRVWQVLSQSRSVSRFKASHENTLNPLIGREHEVTLLASRMGKTLAGDGQTLLLSGEPGIGKSRLVESIGYQSIADKFNRNYLQCSPHHINSALHPVSEWLIRQSGIEREDTAEKKLHKLASYLACQLNQADKHKTEENTAILAKLLLIPLSGDIRPPDLAERELKLRILDILAALLMAHSNRSASMIVVEDAHWIDPTTLELLDQLIDQTPQSFSMVLVTYRPEFIASWIGQAHVTSLPLNRMNPDNCADLIRDVTGQKQLPQEVLDEIIAKTDGIPLFVEELTKTVLESNLLEENSQHYVLAKPLPPLAIPDTLQDSLRARLDRLAPVKEILQIGAVIGREFSHELLAAVARQPEQELTDALQSLLASGLVFQRGTQYDALYIFKHALIRDTAYESILSSAQQILHRRVAETLEQHFPDIAKTDPAQLAFHFEKSGSNPEAIRYWLKAASQALTQSGINEAATHYQHALSIITQLPEEHYTASQEVSTRIALAKALRIIDRYDEAHDTLQVAEQLAKKHNLKADLSTIHYCRGNLYFPQGEIEACMNQHQLALKNALESRLPDREAQALSGLGDVEYLRCHMISAHHYFQRCVGICQAHDLQQIEAANQMMVAWTVMFAKDVFTAIELGEQGVKFAVKINDKRAELIARNLLSATFLDLGKKEESKHNIEQGFTIAQHLGAGRFMSLSSYYRAKLALLNNDHVAAREATEVGLNYSRQSVHAFSGPVLLGIQGRLASSALERRSCWDEAESIFKSGCPGHNRLFFSRDVIETCLQLQDWKACEENCDRLQQHTRNEPLPWSDIVIARGKLLARFGQGDQSNQIKLELQQLESKTKSLGLLSLTASLTNALQTINR